MLHYSSVINNANDKIIKAIFSWNNSKNRIDNSQRRLNFNSIFLPDYYENEFKIRGINTLSKESTRLSSTN